VSAILGQRLAALAAAALLAGVSGVALSQAGTDAPDRSVGEPAVGSWGGWMTALAGVAARVPDGGARSDCGWFVNRRTLGIVHPVLPCGARVFVEVEGRRALTRVVARSPVPGGHELDLTRALASRLDLEGVREIRWAYAR
jgi:hypothetical protein